MNPRISIQIITRDRMDGLAVLLSSLLRQTYQNFDIVLGDNSKGQRIKQHQLCSFTLQRLQYEGHRVMIFDLPSEERDIGKLRNALVKNDPFNPAIIVR